MHAFFTRGPFETPPKLRRRSVSPLSLGCNCSICMPVEEDILIRNLWLARSCGQDGGLPTSQLLGTYRPDIDRGLRCSFSPSLDLRAGKHLDEVLPQLLPQEIPQRQESTPRSEETGEAGEERGKTYGLDGLMDRRSSIDVPLGDSGRQTDLSRRATGRSGSIDGGDIAASERLLEGAETIKSTEAVQQTTVTDTLLTTTEPNPREAALPSTFKKIFRLPKLEFRDHVPFHPPAHSLGPPKAPAKNPKTLFPDHEETLDFCDFDAERRASVLLAANEDSVDYNAPEGYSSPPVAFKRHQTLIEQEVETEERIAAEPHPASDSSLTESILRHLRPAPLHVPGSYRTEHLPTPLADEAVTRDSTHAPRDLVAISRLREATKASTPTITEHGHSIFALRSHPSDASMRPATPVFSPSIYSGRSNASTTRHPLLKASISNMAPVDRGLPISTVLTQTTATTAAASAVSTVVSTVLTQTTATTAAASAVSTVVSTTDVSRRETVMPPTIASPLVSSTPAPTATRRESLLSFATNSRRESRDSAKTTGSYVIGTPTSAATMRPTISTSTSVASLRQMFSTNTPPSPDRGKTGSFSVYSDPDSLLVEDRRVPAMTDARPYSVYSDPEAFKIPIVDNFKKIERRSLTPVHLEPSPEPSPDMYAERIPRTLTTVDEYEPTSKRDSVVANDTVNLGGVPREADESNTASPTTTTVVSITVSEIPSKQSSVRPTQTVQRRVVHTLDDDLLSSPSEQPSTGKYPSAKTPLAEPEKHYGYRAMVAETIVDAAKRAEAYLHGHEVRDTRVSDASTPSQVEAMFPLPDSRRESEMAGSLRANIYTPHKIDFQNPVTLELAGSTRASIKSSNYSSSRRSSAISTYFPPPPIEENGEDVIDFDGIGSNTSPFRSSRSSTRRTSVAASNLLPTPEVAESRDSESAPAVSIKSSVPSSHVSPQPSKSTTASSSRRPSTPSTMSSIQAALTGKREPQYEQLPETQVDSYGDFDNVNLSGDDTGATNSKELVDKKSSASWKTVTSKETSSKESVPPFPDPQPMRRAIPLSRKTSRTTGTSATVKPLKINKTSVERFANKLRSASSEGSLHELPPEPIPIMPPRVREALACQQPNTSPPKPATPVPEETERRKQRNKFKHYRTVHWLKGLLLSHDSDSVTLTQLTSMPARTLRSSRSGRASRSMSVTEEPEDLVAIRTSLLKTHEESGEAFTKTIEDLEGLLSEALLIARQAAEKDEGHDRRYSDSHAPVDYGNGDADGRSYGLPGTGPKLRSVNSVPLSLVSIHESGGSSTSSSSFVSHPSDLYPEQYHTAVRATSGATHGTVVLNAVVDEAPTWRRVRPEDLAPSNRRMSIAAQGLPTPASKTEFKKLLAGPGGAAVADNSTRLRINSRGETRQVTAYMANLSKDFPPPLTKRLSGIERRPSPLSYFAKATETSILNDQSRAASPILKMQTASRQPSKREINRNPSARLATEKSRDQRACRPMMKTNLPTKGEVRDFIKEHHEPPIQPRRSSLALTRAHRFDNEAETGLLNREPSGASGNTTKFIPTELTSLTPSAHSLDGPQDEDDSEVDFMRGRCSGRNKNDAAIAGENIEMGFMNQANEPARHGSTKRMRFRPQSLHLRGLSHVSLDKRHGFSLARSHKRQPIARDWSTARKRFSATVACISTALIGVLVGIYAGLVPSIQYYIADFHHYAILGNVFFYIGLAIPTMVFWPLPLLHGRKPYILSSLALAMPLLFPQAIAVGAQRSPYVATYRVGLLMPRAFMGLALGFANMNFHGILTDLFGASLQSSKPHQELVSTSDVRRHGGGLGVWLGIWTWCYVGSIGLGFLIGSSIINTQSPDWGFYVCIIIIAGVLLLNVITPEVRRSAYRRSVTEVRTKGNVSRRLARGEVMMHRIQTGPKWWGEEVYHGLMLNAEMLRQPGFLLMAIYVGWTYAQVVLVIVVS